MSQEPTDAGDAVIEEIRAIRQQISAECDHDPVKLVAYYMEMQKKYKDRLVNYSKVPIADRGDSECPACQESPSVP